MAEVVAGLHVDAERMQANIALTHGQLFAEAAQFALAPALGRETRTSSWRRVSPRRRRGPPRARRPRRHAGARATLDDAALAACSTRSTTSALERLHRPRARGDAALGAAMPDSSTATSASRMRSTARRRADARAVQLARHDDGHVGAADAALIAVVSRAALRHAWPRRVERPPGPYTIAHARPRRARAAAHVQCARAHFCGLSMSGLVGLWLALNEPAFLDHLVLANTAARSAARDLDARIARIEARGCPPSPTPSCSAGSCPRSSPRHRRFVAARRCCAITRRRLQRPAPRCGTPIPRRSRPHRDADARDRRHARPRGDAGGRPYMAERIADARYVELDAAHLSNLERPAEFTQALVDFLS
jgi:3-oxoadipate enol-lactonase